MKIKHMVGLLSFFLLVLLLAVGCSQSDDSDDDSNDETTSVVKSYGGSDPKGDLITIQLNRTDSTVRHINHTSDPDDDTGWLSYTSFTGTDAAGFSILKKVELSGGEYVLFAEFPDTAIVYQVFDASNNSVGNPVYAVFRESVDKSAYNEKAYNWMKFTISDETVGSGSQMEVGFAAFDSAANEGLLFGSGYNSYDDSVTDINQGDTAKVDSFAANTELTANTMWLGTTGDLTNAITLTGTASGTNILDCGPNAGGGMGLAIPQSSVSLSTVAGTYFLLVYEGDKGSSAGSVDPLKVVISATSPHIKVFQFTDDTSTATPIFSNDLVTVADLTAAESPGGATAIVDQFQSVSGNSTALSSTVRNAHNAAGTYVAIQNPAVIAILFDPNGGFFGFTMSDGTADLIRFGFGIKDSNYANP